MKNRIGFLSCLMLFVSGCVTKNEEPSTIQNGFYTLQEQNTYLLSGDGYFEYRLYHKPNVNEPEWVAFYQAKGKWKEEDGVFKNSADSTRRAEFDSSTNKNVWLAWERINAGYGTGEPIVDIGRDGFTVKKCVIALNGKDTIRCDNYTYTKASTKSFPRPSGCSVHCEFE